MAIRSWPVLSPLLLIFVAKLLERARALEASTTLEIFYKINCPHCAAFMASGVSELVNAGLPGDRLDITILPMIKPPDGRPQCMEDPLCANALSPLCALKPMMPPPMPADAAGWPSIVKFLSCDVMHTGGGEEFTPSTVQRCASDAGLDSTGIQDCANGMEAFDLLFSDNYSGRILDAIRRLQEAGFPDHIAMPWVFLNGELLECSGSGCTGAKQPYGITPLQNPGSLLYLVCSKLDPKPDACMNVEGYQSHHTVAKLTECLNCEEMTKPEWHDTTRGTHWSSTAMPLAFAMFFLASVALLVSRVLPSKFVRRPSRAARTSESMPLTGPAGDSTTADETGIASME
mmetsp:Transcript_80179/g.201749  ORF Transcript_80179/g.201749 Transcript_80179/m.201749 type:complete len:345 (+) Transcript_80179:67-1101(+)